LRVSIDVADEHFDAGCCKRPPQVQILNREARFKIGVCGARAPGRRRPSEDRLLNESAGISIRYLDSCDVAQSADGGRRGGQKRNCSAGLD
jgi:hypothetical protein